MMKIALSHRYENICVDKLENNKLLRRPSCSEFIE